MSDADSSDVAVAPPTMPVPLLAAGRDHQSKVIGVVRVEAFGTAYEFHSAGDDRWLYRSYYRELSLRHI